MKKREKLVMAAVAGLSLGLQGPAAGAAEEAKDSVKCWGINGCGSSAKCSVTDADLNAFKALLGEKDYKARFGKSETHSCGSTAKCGAAMQVLNWMPTSAADCKAKGGYLVEETAGKKVAKKA